MGSHTGTHVDVYSHMHEGKETLDDNSDDIRIYVWYRA